MSARIVIKALAALLIALAAPLAVAQTKINLGTQAIGGTGLGTALITSNGTSALTGYAGANCTNQFPRALSAVGAATCASVVLTADVSGILPTANGGTGIAYFTAAGPTVARVYTFPDAAATILYSGGALGTPSSGTLTNATGLPLTGLATQATNTIIGNATSGTASPTALAIGSCSTSSSALQWTTDSGFGCNTSIAANTSTSATNATNATNIGVSDAASDTTTWVLLGGSQTGTQGALTDGGITYDANANALTATTFVGALTGNASTATSATDATNAANTAITDDTTTNATMYPTWVTTSSGNQAQKMSSTKLTFNPSTSTLTATNFAGNASTATSATSATTATTATNQSGGTVSATTGDFSGTVTLSGAAANIAIGANFISNGGTDAGLSLDASNNAALSANLALASAGAGDRITISGAGTGSTRVNLSNTGATLYVGIDNSAGNAVITGSSAYASILATSGATPLILGTNSVANLTIASGGNATLSGTLTLTNISSDATHTDATICVDTTSKTLYYGSGTLGICLGTSSERYKRSITPLAAGLPAVMALRPVSYYLDAEHGDPAKLLYGFTAEQAGAVVPDLMGKDAEGRPNTFDYVGVVPVLVRAIQEQQEQIEALHRAIEELRGIRHAAPQ